MAAPPEINLSNLTGDWVMNKTLSDDPDPVLALQGVGWLTRKAISWATVTLHITQWTEDNLVRIKISNTATGGIKGTTEDRTLDWEWHDHEDDMFGKLQGRSRLISRSNLSAGNGPDGGLGQEEVVDAFLLEGWLEEGDSLQSVSVNDGKGWMAVQIWGFAVVDGKRFHVRRVVVRKGDEVVKVRLVYDWQGKQ